MNHKFAIFASLALLSFGVSAETLTQHPALPSTIESNAATLNAARFIVGHPAGGQSHGGHANHDHPAVVAARDARTAFDTNRFLVQPPASTRWTVTTVEAGSKAE